MKQHSVLPVSKPRVGIRSVLPESEERLNLGGDRPSLDDALYLRSQFS